jgi:hypothetical protein
MVRLLQLILVTSAALSALFPPPPPWVECVYSLGAYPRIQQALTWLSNQVRLPLFDLAVTVLVLVAIGLWAAAWRARRQSRSWRPLLQAAGRTLVLLACVYLWFVLVWGLNYRRPAIETTIPFDRTRVTAGAVRDLAEIAVAQANRLHGPAHRAGFAAIDDVPAPLLASLHRVERALGRPRPTVAARPKRPWQSPFFRASGVSGMLAPFLLETYLNPDLTPPERAIVLAHEWAHLAGHAPEDEASFVGMLAALGADVSSQYSAWLDLVSEASSQLEGVTGRLVLQRLEEGPRRDQEQVRRRLQSLVRPVQRASWTTYDRMLKSHGVEEGVRSYGGVIELLVGSGAITASGEAVVPVRPGSDDVSTSARGNEESK